MELQSNEVIAVENKRRVCLVWEDLTVVASNGRSSAEKELLKGLNGYAEPNRIMALIGPSGSGKSTLLAALAGILPNNVRMTGNVILNGSTRRTTGCKDVCYVTQEDYFLGTLTVKETLTYAARLRLPSYTTRNEIEKVVTNVLAEMGLEDSAESRLGNWHLRGISTGEKRRLSIGIEILTQPHVMFLDEPTSGLDSAASFYVISSLSNIAHDGRIVICSIHQPSGEIFNLFDDLVLLAAGETVYFGQATMAVKFFADAGFPCPIRKNPPEHFLRCVSPEFDTVTALIKSKIENNASSSCNSLMDMTTEEIKSELVMNYKNSIHSENARRKIREMKKILQEEPLVGKIYDTSWLKQLCTLTNRSFLNMTRDFGYYWLRIVLYIILSVSAGCLLVNVGTSNEAIISRGKCDGFIFGLMIFLCLGGVPFYHEELKVFKRERFGKHYGEAIFVLSHFLSSLPFVLAISLSSGTILYHMVNFHPGFSHYCYFCMNIFCFISVTEGCTLLVAALLPDLLVALGTATGVIVFLMVPSNVFRSLADIPKFFWRYPMSYLSYITWSIQGQFKNDLIGLEFEPQVAGDAKIKGEDILQVMFGIRTDYSKWWDLGVLVCFLICYRVLYYLALKHKERASSLWQIKRTILHIFLKKPSLKDKYTPSKRHHSLHPLSVQEGLNSPLS
ncbi:ABC transporter G family member 15-like [Vigna radiata var. radiata]|uniref:ABC transporter G family member 15-like n=1 Tax=Vigna radiata var. radiata TaxID=3916 RepID=A0A1S3TNK0_VIGRR|nr:ABC transporter G family member 15-like [Vigna radiata var. radiata]